MFQVVKAHCVPAPEVLWLSTSFSAGLSSNSVGMKESRQGMLVFRHLFRCCPKINLMDFAPLEALNLWDSSGLIPCFPQRPAFST